MELGKYLDETRTLGYGQVFVQFSGTRHEEFYDDSIIFSGIWSDQRFVVEGKVVVAKNPCLHPRDVRVLRAVDVPALVVGSWRETYGAGGDATDCSQTHAAREPNLGLGHGQMAWRWPKRDPRRGSLPSAISLQGLSAHNPVFCL